MIYRNPLQSGGLIHPYADNSMKPAKIGAHVVLARDFFGKVRTFLRLAEKLALSRTEELSMLTLSAGEWQRWRALAVPPTADVPPLLERRMDYAITLLERMVANATPETPAPGDEAT